MVTETESPLITSNYKPTKELSNEGADLVDRAKTYIRAILHDSLHIQPSERVYILYDEDVELTQILTAAYADIANEHTNIDFTNFNQHTADDILAHLATLKANDCVILIQSQQFRLNEYRIRLELFKRNIKTIEHLHLNIIKPKEYKNYVESLAFSPVKYRDLALRIKDKLDKCQKVLVECQDGSQCEYTGGMNDCKLNIGDYKGMSGIGGTYPIGEVFTESRDLSKVNGQMSIWAYPSLAKTLEIPPEPIVLTIKNGLIEFDPENGIYPKNSTETFNQLLTLIRDGEGEICVREFGLGLNEGMGKSAIVTDVSAFERQHGMHISLGKKHNVYKTSAIKTKQTRFHIDVFIDLKNITILDDNTCLFDDGKYLV
ncbi:unnamed protein product [Rotaria sordida]|uniref:Thermophilic metalloprotease (M29) n=1 Tax=Rotaria sordida TaxID=392033 RepID=A0A818LSC1_9BILA|nr:unnamed protein product [Rotaria sordida]CAF3579314.1 unnamed protein product [Rotaria sordida]